VKKGERTKDKGKRHKTQGAILIVGAVFNRDKRGLSYAVIRGCKPLPHLIFCVIRFLFLFLSSEFRMLAAP
jgi:hypothetical protein